MAKVKGSAGRTGTVKPNAPAPAASGGKTWDPTWEADKGDISVPAYLITPDGTILDNRKILSGKNYKGAWADSHDAAIKAVAKRNGWAVQGNVYSTVSSRGWGAGRVWNGISRNNGGFVDVRVGDNALSGFKRAQAALATLVSKGIVGINGRFGYAWGLGSPGTSYQGEGLWSWSVRDFMDADGYRDLPPG